MGLMVNEAISLSVEFETFENCNKDEIHKAKFGDYIWSQTKLSHLSLLR